MQRSVISVVSTSMWAWGCANAASPSANQNQALVMTGISPSPDHSLETLSVAVYTEAFRRIGVKLVVLSMPPVRGAFEAQRGAIDGELGRGPDYGASHPGMVRVDEPAFYLALSAYSTTPGTYISGWQALSNYSYRIEYRWGIEAASSRLNLTGNSTTVSGVATTLQGLQKLAIGRTDVYVDFEEHVDHLLRTNCFKNKSMIFRAGELQRLPIHAYLNQRNAALAPKLSQALRSMKQEGMIRMYQHELSRTERHVALCPPAATQTATAVRID